MRETRLITRPRPAGNESQITYGARLGPASFHLRHACKPVDPGRPAAVSYPRPPAADRAGGSPVRARRAASTRSCAVPRTRRAAGPLSGVMGLLAQEDGGGHLVVDYKSDRVGASPDLEELGPVHDGFSASLHALAALARGSRARRGPPAGPPTARGTRREDLEAAQLPAARNEAFTRAGRPGPLGAYEADPHPRRLRQPARDGVALFLGEEDPRERPASRPARGRSPATSIAVLLAVPPAPMSSWPRFRQHLLRAADAHRRAVLHGHRGPHGRVGDHGEDPGGAAGSYRHDRHSWSVIGSRVKPSWARSRFVASGSRRARPPHGHEVGHPQPPHHPSRARPASAPTPPSPGGKPPPPLPVHLAGGTIRCAETCANALKAPEGGGRLCHVPPSSGPSAVRVACLTSPNPLASARRHGTTPSISSPGRS